MAGFLLMTAAANSARRREKMEKFERKQKKRGFKQELVLSNPNSCYVHLFRKTQKAQKGMMQIAIFMSILSIAITMYMKFESYWFVAIIFAVIGIIVGWSNMRNTQTIHDGSTQHTPMDGYVFLRTDRDANYHYVWKNEKGETEKYREEYDFDDDDEE